MHLIKHGGLKPGNYYYFLLSICSNFYNIYKFSIYSLHQLRTLSYLSNLSSIEDLYQSLYLLWLLADKRIVEAEKALRQIPKDKATFCDSSVSSVTVYGDNEQISTWQLQLEKTLLKRCSFFMLALRLIYLAIFKNNF